MLNHSYDRSFIATIQCVTPGREGYFDCAKLAEREGQAARAADDWMIVTSLTLREPHLFWFRCLFDESRGRPYYDIQSWSRRTGRDFQSSNRHLDFNHNGYPGLYPQVPEDARLWKFITRQEDGNQASMTSIVEAGQQLDGQIWTRSNLALRAMEPEHVADHWFAYVNTSKGEVLDVRLEVLHIGEELMDDH
ncbi:MAG: hypothetical protein EOP15_03390 [Pseudomonas sp.]|nr:MAG: hypothetical protein EOP15_03390 [Pseudomonas sp.]